MRDEGELRTTSRNTQISQTLPLMRCAGADLSVRFVARGLFPLLAQSPRGVGQIHRSAGGDLANHLATLDEDHG